MYLTTNEYIRRFSQFCKGHWSLRRTHAPSHIVTSRQTTRQASFNVTNRLPCIGLWCWTLSIRSISRLVAYAHLVTYQSLLPAKNFSQFISTVLHNVACTHNTPLIFFFRSPHHLFHSFRTFRMRVKSRLISISSEYRKYAYKYIRKAKLQTNKNGEKERKKEFE